MSTEIITSPQPYFLPGYTGFCPQFKYRSGHTFGSTTHKLLIDPTISHAEHLVLSDLADDDFEVIRYPMMMKDVAQNDIKCDHSIFEETIVPSFTDFRKKKYPEWSPLSAIQPELLLPMIPSTIYPLHIAQIPNYAGHIPGGSFRYGKTFGNDSRDCKRWLCGDYSN